MHLQNKNYVKQNKISSVMNLIVVEKEHTYVYIKFICKQSEKTILLFLNKNEKNLKTILNIAVFEIVY